MFGPVVKQPKSYFMLIILSRYKTGTLSLFLSRSIFFDWSVNWHYMGMGTANQTKLDL